MADGRVISKWVRAGTALLVVLGLGVAAGAVGGMSMASASSSTSASCSDAPQPVGGYTAPTGPSPAPDASTMADWSGQSAPVSNTGHFVWTSSAQQITGVPNSIVVAMRIDGGQVTQSTPFAVKPVVVGPGSAPGTELTELQVTMDVSCVSGSPRVSFWEARAEGNTPSPGSSPSGL